MRAISTVSVAVLVLVIAGCAPGAPGGAGQDRGAVVYATHCASCHQRDGRGVGKNPPLAGSATVAGDPETLIAWTLFGVRPATLPARRGLVVMPQYSWLSDEDVAAVLTHVRSSFGNAQPAITPAEVAAVRAASGHP